MIVNDGEPIELFEDYQPQAIERMVKLGRLLLYMDMGLGKTVCALKYAETLQPQELFIVAPRKATFGWLRMMRRWYPTFLKEFRIILDNSQAARATKWATCPKFVITTWNILQRDDKFIRKRNYHMVIADEVHKVMRSRKTKSRDALKGIHSMYLCLLSGSPIAGRNGGEWWTYLNLLNSRAWPSYWKFTSIFAFVEEGYFGKDVFGFKNVESLQKVLRDYVVIVLKKDLGRQRKIRGFLEVEMTEPQRRVYEELRDNMYSVLNLESGNVIVSSTTLTNVVRLRQLLACPAIFDPLLGYGGAIDDLCEQLLDLPREKRHTMVFTPFRDVVPWIARALVERKVVEAKDIFHFMGGLTIDQLGSQLDEWKIRQGIGIGTIAYGESYDMETADKAFFVGYDWDPQVNAQAEDRIDRVINKHTVLNMHYFRYVGTVDDDVMSHVVLKQQNLNHLLKDPKRLALLLRKRRIEEELVA